MASHLSVIHSKWHHHFNNLQFSTQEFYALVEIKLKEENIKGIHLERVSYTEGGIFSSKREYLRISRKGLIFDICAAPFGKGFFVSWWHGESVGFIKDLLAKIPVVGPVIVKVSSLKTFYQMDTEQMYKEVVKSCVQNAIEEITSSKGVKGLSELERMDSSYSKR